jgi:septal ring factor EnvC (AmiA/AmiB activator)
MDNKYSKFTLPQLTTEYFEFERKINNLNTEKSKLDEQINNLYDERCSVYNLIKTKQVEEDEIRKQNLIKYGQKVKLEDNIQLNRDYGMSLSDLKNAK